jgi:RNA polymerase sigma-70 factor, ECF subfamily
VARTASAASLVNVKPGVDVWQRRLKLKIMTVEEIMAYRGSVLAYVQKRAPSDAEDIVQRAFIKALANRTALADPGRLRPWLFQIARNELFDHFRAHRRQRTEPLDDQIQAPEAPVDNTCPCVLSELAGLGLDDSALLAETILEERSATEVAATTGEAPGTVMVRAHRARKKLQARLKKHCGVSSFAACLSCRCAERGSCAMV